MELPELKPGPHSLGEPSRPLMTSDGLTFAWCYKKDEAAELARRSNLFPKLVEMLDELLDDQKCTADEPGEITPCRHCNVRLRADALLADIRQSEQEGGHDGTA